MAHGGLLTRPSRWRCTGTFAGVHSRTARALSTERFPLPTDFFIQVFGKCSLLSRFVYSTPGCYKINRPMVGGFDTTFDFTVKSRRMVEESGN